MDIIDLPHFLAASRLLQRFTDWNVILFVIGGCSILAFTVFIERMVHLHRAGRDNNTLIIRLRQAIEDRNNVEAVRICEDTGGPVASILRAGILRYDQGREQIEHAMENRGLLEIANLEKNAKILSVIGHIAPLIGLLGTVLGFIEAFSQMRQTGMMDISTTRIGAAMEYALLTTAAGLVVAIPTVVSYNYIVARIESFVLEIQGTSAEVVDLLLNRDRLYDR